MERRFRVGKTLSRRSDRSDSADVGRNIDPAQAQAPSLQRPNIVVIMGDDIGIWNIGAYHRGMMAGRTPNLDKLAAEGMMFTDYYAEASCTAGRANFITGQLPIRTGMTTVGQAGAPIGLPRRRQPSPPRSRPGLRHRPVRQEPPWRQNEFLPTVHGFDQFFGYLYHLDAMEDPCHPNYPQDLRSQVGPRNMVRSVGDHDDDATSIRAGARSASRRSRMPANCARSAWKPWTTKSATTR